VAMQKLHGRNALVGSGLTRTGRADVPSPTPGSSGTPTCANHAR
jgi:hypothetical protein